MIKYKPAIRWPGGKSRLVNNLLPHISKHTCYVEVFGGGLALLLAKERSKIEVANDLNHELVSFYRVVKWHCDELLRELEFMPNSRKEFDDFLSQPGLTEIQQVARWFVRNAISFGGMGSHFGTGKKSGGASHGSRETRMKTIRELNKRFDKVCIENLSWEKVIERYDAPETFFFCDPPYFDPGGDAYAGWGELDFIHLANALKCAQGQWILTFQDCETVRKVFDGYHIESIERANGIGNRGKNPSGRKYHEVIVVGHNAKRAKNMA